MESITFLASYFSRPNTITLGYLAVQVGHARTGVRRSVCSYGPMERDGTRVYRRADGLGRWFTDQRVTANPAIISAVQTKNGVPT